MNQRLAKLDRLLTLVHRLSETSEGLTLDDMADYLSVNRRTAERLRNLVARHFDLEEFVEERKKRFRIRDSLRRVYTKPTPAEIAVLQTEIDRHRNDGAPHLAQLESLLSKVKSALDQGEKRRLAPDLEALTRLQRSLVRAGPIVNVPPETLTVIQQAILTGHCVEFHYASERRPQPGWRRVVPYGLIYDRCIYLIGKMPEREDNPFYFRLDRMVDPVVSDVLGHPPDDWDLDAWLAESFAIFREDAWDIILYVPPAHAERARCWHFHPLQVLENLSEGGLRVHFRAGGLREIAEHLFLWAGEIIIEQPPALRDVLRERLTLAETMLAPSRSPSATPEAAPYLNFTASD